MIVTFDEIRALLASKPTIKTWREEIYRIVDGERDGFLNRFGSVSGYIENILLISNNRKSEIYFHKALEQIIAQWDTSLTIFSENREKEYYATMLEFIGTYTPASGGRKIYSFLEDWKYSIDEMTINSGYNSETDITLLALESLGKYISPNPQNNDFYSYENYVNTLEEYLFIPRYTGNIVVILLKSAALKLTDGNRIKYILEKEPKVINYLFSYVFMKSQKHKIRENLTNLCIHSFSIGGEVFSLFKELLNFRDGDLKINSQMITISIPNLEPIIIETSFHKDPTSPFVLNVNPEDILGGIFKDQNVKEIEEAILSIKHLSIGKIKEFALEGKKKAEK